MNIFRTSYVVGFFAPSLKSSFKSEFPLALPHYLISCAGVPPPLFVACSMHHFGSSSLWNRPPSIEPYLLLSGISRLVEGESVGVLQAESDCLLPSARICS